MEKTNCTLVCDSRERHVTRHAKEFEGISFETKQITTGDYVILGPAGNILAIIERKSLEDFAASFKDGRAENRKKLIEMRRVAGCRIVYIIEGDAFPQPSTLYGNIPYRYIESSIFHLMVRDGITVLQTRDSLDTAKTLARFVISMDSLCRKLSEPDGQFTDSPIASEDLVNVQPVDRGEIFEMLTKKHEKSDHEVVRTMWSCFAGISIESADEFIRTWSLADILSGRVRRDDITGFRHLSGRKISKKVIASLTDISKQVEVRLLSAIPGVSRATATELVTATPLRRLLSYSVDVIGIQTIGKSGRKLGTALAEKILRYFNYKYESNLNAQTEPILI